MTGGPARRAPALPPNNLLPLALQLFLGHLILRPWTRFFCRIRVRRSRHFPDGACVLASNHRSYSDPGLIGMWQARPISYFARDNLWEKPVIAFFLNAMYGIPIDRANPGISSMKGAVDRLRRGIPVLVFPEGTRTRNGRLSPLHEGPALFARRAGVPLVPVYLFRSEALWPRDVKLPRLYLHHLEIRFGSPIIPPSTLDPRAQDTWVSQRLTAWMQRQERELLGPA